MFPMIRGRPTFLTTTFLLFAFLAAPVGASDSNINANRGFGMAREVHIFAPRYHTTAPGDYDYKVTLGIRNGFGGLKLTDLASLKSNPMSSEPPGPFDRGGDSFFFGLFVFRD